MNLKSKLLVFLLFFAIQSGFTQTIFEVMTFNVRYDEALFYKGRSRPTDWAKRKVIQVELIKKYNPDVIGMQEPHLHQVKYLAENLESYSWLGAGREDGKEKDEFNPIFYRKDKLSVLNSGTFWLSETPDIASRSWDAGYNRICTWALFECKISKEQFYVFNTHFDSKGKDARLQSASLINERIQTLTGNKPVAVTGDFNFQPDSVPYSEMISKGLSDSKKISEYDPRGSEGTFNGFRFGATQKRRIDFIFVNDKVKVKKYEVINNSKDRIYPSDHFPVAVELEI